MSLSGEDLGKKLAGVLGIPSGNITELRIICKGGPGARVSLQAGAVMNKLLCLLVGHQWTCWRLHPCYGNKQMRNCPRCGKAQERRI